MGSGFTNNELFVFSEMTHDEVIVCEKHVNSDIVAL